MDSTAPYTIAEHVMVGFPSEKKNIYIYTKCVLISLLIRIVWSLYIINL